MTRAVAGKVSSMAGNVSGEILCVTFMAVSEHWERNTQCKRLRLDI